MIATTSTNLPNKRVALIIELDNPRVWNIARGVIQRAKRYQWDLFSYGSMFQPMGQWEDWTGDGIISLIKSERDAQPILAKNIPTIDVAGAIEHPSMSRVLNDDVQIGEKAAFHLRLGRFDQYYFCGVPHLQWSQRRHQGYQQGLKPLECKDSFWGNLEYWESPLSDPSLEAWLKTLPPSSALFCCHDAAACKVSRACHRLGISIPQDLALLGIDNDEVICELSTPSLSSIPLNEFKMGLEAADALKQWWKSGQPHDQLITPLEIVTRESTNIRHSPDHLMQKAMTIIQEKACQGMNVTELLAELDMNRRTLEQRFKKAYAMSPLQAITHTKCEHAKRLILGNHLKSRELAQSCGYQSLSCFMTAFKKHTGMSPKAYREQQR